MPNAKRYVQHFVLTLYMKHVSFSDFQFTGNLNANNRICDAISAKIAPAMHRMHIVDYLINVIANMHLLSTEFSFVKCYVNTLSLSIRCAWL